MSKKLIVLLLGALGAQSLSALASPTMQCEPPVLSVPADPTAGSAQYVVHCQGADPDVIAPTVDFAGELLTRGSPPYAIKATYTVNTQGDAARKLGQRPRVDQIVTGSLTSSAVSAATLPAQFAAQTSWDASSGTLSIEEREGKWRAYSTRYTAENDPSILEAGSASGPVKDGRATARIDLSSRFSRFGGATAATRPVVDAVMGLREGKLEVRVGDTQVANQSSVQDALLQLDRQPKSIIRAWALASRAQYLGMSAEVQYAEQKIAAYHPDLLEEFQLAVQRIKPYAVY